MAYIYAKINKDTLRFIREKKQVSFEYIQQITKFPKEKILMWEDIASGKYPTINQAKTLAKCYHVPFAGFYMNCEDISIKHLPPIMNKRTMVSGINDNSAVNLAVLDLINHRDFYVETKGTLRESIPIFDLQISDNLSVSDWASKIREFFNINLVEQYQLTSKRKFYLYLRKRIEAKGVFIQGFQKVDVTILRGVAIIDGSMPIIGINDEDRYPAKSFSIIHELVHIIKRTSTICNDMYGTFPLDSEEVFCNAVAGEVLVPREALFAITKNHTDFSIDVIDSIANRFSVSSEVIARRLYDTGVKKEKDWYEKICLELDWRIQVEKENQKESIRNGLTDGPRRVMSREAVDRTSSALCDILLRGFSEGLFDKADISAHIGIGERHIDKFVSEVMGWYL